MQINSVDPITGRFQRRTKSEHITIQGKCIDCKERDQERKSVGRDGLPRYGPRCGRCATRNYRAGMTARGEHRVHTERGHTKSYKKKDHCEGCGFKANYPIQLDVDHIDGNHANDDPANLWTLCANCHREKTWLFDNNGAI